MSDTDEPQSVDSAGEESDVASVPDSESPANAPQDQELAEDGQEPAENEQELAEDGQESQEMAENDQELAEDDQEPTEDRQEPAEDGQEPAEDGQELADDGQEPAEDGQELADDGQEPAKDGQEPAEDGEQTRNVEADLEESQEGEREEPVQRDENGELEEEREQGGRELLEGVERPEDLDPNTAEQPDHPLEGSLLPRRRIAINCEKYPLNLKWVLGIGRTLPVFCLADENRLEIAYACANVAIIYDHSCNSQHLFQGHCNPISCLCASEDQRWLVTADVGTESLVLVWDTHSGFPVQTLFHCHPEGGVAAMALSRDAKYLVTVGAAEVQRVCIWDWTSETEGPLCDTVLQPELGYQTHIVFHPNDNCQIVSNSEGQVVFYTWEEGKLDYYAPKVSDKTFKRKVGSLSQSLFSTEGFQAFSGTSLGNAVVWDVLRTSSSDTNTQRTALMLLQLEMHAITVLTCTDAFIVTGNAGGHVTFYNQRLRLIKWYDQFDLDPITSISFSKETHSKVGHLDSVLNGGKPSLVRNFVLSTASAHVAHVNTVDGQLRWMVKEQSIALHALACHPTQPVVAMGSHCGTLRTWDYENKVTERSRVFQKEREIQCLAFDPRGFYLAVGFACGTVYILNPEDLQNNPEEKFRCAHDGITHIAFSKDSHYLATADSGKAVTLYSLSPKHGQLVWDFQWRHRYHYEPIQDLLFGEYPASAQPMLLSLGSDRRLVEYDLKNSCEDELRVRSAVKVEQSATPTCMVWHPPISTELLLTAADSCKMKLFNSAKMCRKTVLGPTHSSPVQKMAVLPTSPGEDPDTHYLAYIAGNKLGLQILPVDGNPYKSSAIICHPSGISGLSCSSDGKYVFTSGGNDATVCCWEVNRNALQAEAALGGQGIEPFYTLLEGGRDGQLFKDISDYFYYCQLQLQGIDSMELRIVSSRLPLSELSVTMRALGFFPSDREIEDLQNEVLYSRYAETGALVRDVDLEDFIRLYINHRPLVDHSGQELQHAFSVLGHLTQNGEQVIARDDLLHLLQTRGEPMSEEELADCFTVLLGARVDRSSPEHESLHSTDSKDLLERILPEQISLETFVVDILGWSSSTGAPLSRAESPVESQDS